MWRLTSGRAFCMAVMCSRLPCRIRADRARVELGWGPGSDWPRGSLPTGCSRLSNWKDRRGRLPGPVRRPHLFSFLRRPPQIPCHHATTGHFLPVYKALVVARLVANPAPPLCHRWHPRSDCPPFCHRICHHYLFDLYDLISPGGTVRGFRGLLTTVRTRMCAGQIISSRLAVDHHRANLRPVQNLFWC